MKIFSVMSQKGGAGKTTLAINLAVQAHKKGKKVIVVDIDPQASVSTWGDIRGKETPPLVVASFATRLKNVLDVAKNNKINEVFLDTPPHSQRDAQIAAEIADIILIPCRPNMFDLQAIEDTIVLAQMAKKKHIIIFNAVHHNRSLAKEAKKALLDKYKKNINICPAIIVQRMTFVHASTNGQGVQEYEAKGKASSEINSVYNYICGQASIKTRRKTNG